MTSFVTESRTRAVERRVCKRAHALHGSTTKRLTIIKTGLTNPRVKTFVPRSAVNMAPEKYWRPDFGKSDRPLTLNAAANAAQAPLLLSCCSRLSFSIDGQYHMP